MRKNQNGFIHIFILIAVVITGIAVFIYFAYKNGNTSQPVSSPSDQAYPSADFNKINWKKCTNYDLNIEFDCPSTWVFDKKDEIDFPIFYQADYSGELHIVLKFYYGKNGESQQALSFSEYRKDIESDLGDLSTISIAGTEGFSYTNKKGEKTMAFLYPNIEDDVHIVELIFKTKNAEIEEKVINTLSIIDLLELSTWKEYKDQELGVKFMYRPDLEIGNGNNSRGTLISSSSNSFNLISYDFLFYTTMGHIDMEGRDAVDYAQSRLCGGGSEDGFWIEVAASCREGIKKTFKNTKTIM